MECIELPSKIWSRLFTRLLQALSSQRETSLTSQTHLIHVTAFWQYVHSWTIIVKDEAQEEYNFNKNLWWTPWELPKNCSHCHQTSLMH